MHNYWTILKYPFAEWEIELPFSGSPSAITNTLDFAQRLLSLGANYEVYCLRKANTNLDIQENSHSLYLDYIDKHAGIGDYFAYFDISSNEIVEIPDLVVTSRICYYDNGKLATSHISNVASLLRRLYTQEKGVPLERFLPQVSPIVIKGNRIELNKNDLSFSKSITLSIELYTDIWFPRLQGILENISAYQEGDMYDNAELSLCHTLRLNDFLRDVKALVLEFGGTWRLLNEETGYTLYRGQLTETGIKL